jgi:broad specificity phosphatase PhoE
LLPVVTSESAEREHAGPRRVLVVSHARFIRTLLKHLRREGELRCADGVAIGTCQNAAVAVVEVVAEEFEDDRWIIEECVLVKYGDLEWSKEGESDDDQS